MMENEKIKVDLNVALEEELIAVPGIGPALARRIIAARPFDTVDEVTRVQGIGEKFLEELRPFLIVVSPVISAESEIIEESEPEVVETYDMMDDYEEESEHEVVEVEPVPVEEAEVQGLVEDSEDAEELVEQAIADAEIPEELPVLEEPVEEMLEEAVPEVEEQVAPAETVEAPKVEEKTKAEKPEKAGPKRGEMLGYNIGFAIVALVLGVLITLGILAAINGTLVYAPAGRFVAVERQADMLDARMDIVDEDIASLRTRIDALEALSGRVSDLEAETASLRTELNTYEEQLAQLDERLLQLDERTAALEESAKVFDAFLEGLRSLMLDVMPEAVESVE